MAENNLIDFRFKTCPKCGKNYRGPSATSRQSNSLYICPDCGTREALESIGIDSEEQEQIIEIIAKHTSQIN